MALAIECVTSPGHIECPQVQGESIDTDPAIDDIAYRHFNAALEVGSQKTGSREVATDTLAMSAERVAFSCPTIKQS
jgi:hypothetical protein